MTSRRPCPHVLSTAALLTLLLSQPGATQVPGIASAGSGCQPGQVLMANGDPCMPPPALPATPVNVLGLTPADMSRMLSAPTAPATMQPQCPPGQVLQANGQPCVAPLTPPAAAR